MRFLGLASALLGAALLCAAVLGLLDAPFPGAALEVTGASQPVDNRGFSRYHGRLRVEGAKLMGSKSGEQVQLLGMSTHGLQWFSSCYTKESMETIASSWGVNVVRIAMYVAVEEHGYKETPKKIYSVVKDMLEWTHELGIYAIVDWHTLSPGDPWDPAYTTNTTATNGTKEDPDSVGLDTLSFFRGVASLVREKGYDHVLYEVANEPNPMNSADPEKKPYHDVKWLDTPGVRKGVRSYHQDFVIPAIRSVDPHGVIICGTTTWSQDIDQAAANPISAPWNKNVMYTFHFYAGSHVGLLPRLESVAQKIPIFVTEWGVTAADGSGTWYFDNAKKFLALAKELKISAAQWNYADNRGKNDLGGTNVLGQDACARRAWNDTTGAGDFIRSYIQSNVMRVPQLQQPKQEVIYA